MAMEQDAADEAGAEEENYFVSMTDMMVGILFIFIIMLMMFALNFRQQADVQVQKIDVAEEVADTLRRQNRLVQDAIEAIEAAEQARARMLDEIRLRLEALKVPVQIDERNGVLRLTEEAVRFPSNRSDLSEATGATVDTVGRVLGETLGEFSRCSRTVSEAACAGAGAFRVETVFIEGHTDVRGEDKWNWTLSTERAVNTYLRLVHAEPGLRTLRNSKGEEILSVSGYSSARPLPSRGISEGDDWQQNRRIDLRFVMENNDRSRLTEIQSLLGRMEDELAKLRRSPELDPTSGGPQP